MTDALKARDAKDVEDACAGRWPKVRRLRSSAAAASARSAVRADRTSRSICRVFRGHLYEPEELVLSAKAGTPLAEIEALVEQRGQQLGVRADGLWSDFRWDAGAGSSAVALAANLSGPRRIKAGAARDHFLGFSAVSGRGETFKSGGRVVKNVTGYDLCKLMAGSFGTLAAMTEVTIKTLPRPEAEATVIVLGLDDVGGQLGDVGGDDVVMRRIRSGAFAGRSGRASRGAGRAGGRHRVPLEGFAPSVKHREAALICLLAPFGAIEVHRRRDSRKVGGCPRRRAVLGSGSWGDWPLWRISTTPARGANSPRSCRPPRQSIRLGGRVDQYALPPSHSAGADTVRRAAASTGGHATLIRAPCGDACRGRCVRAARGALAAVTRRVKGKLRS